MSGLEDLLARFLPGAGHFAAPLWLLALPLLAAGAVLGSGRVARSALAWPGLGEAEAAGARAWDPLRTLGGLLRAGTCVALGLVLARPLGPARPLSLRSEGLDLLLVLDTSASMRALDARGADRSRTRLDLAREVVAHFARRRLAAGDRVGLVVFGEHVLTQCPLTRDGRLLEAALSRVKAGMAGEATALGDALALAVRRLGDGGEAGAEQGPKAGRVAVLLTDGRSNDGSVPTEIAAALARQRGVRVHTVGIGGQGPVAMAVGTGRKLRLERHDLDFETLEEIAAASGGRSFRARSSQDLAAVYTAIDRLERVPRLEHPGPGSRWARPAPEPALAAAGALLLAELLLLRIFARRLP